MHGLARGGEDIGLELGWVWFKVFFAATGETGVGCVSETGLQVSMDWEVAELKARTS